MQLQKIKSLQQLGLSLDEIIALSNDKEPVRGDFREKQLKQL